MIGRRTQVLDLANRDSLLQRPSGAMVINCLLFFATSAAMIQIRGGRGGGGYNCTKLLISNPLLSPQQCKKGCGIHLKNVIMKTLDGNGIDERAQFQLLLVRSLKSLMYSDISRSKNNNVISSESLTKHPNSLLHDATIHLHISHAEVRLTMC